MKKHQILRTIVAKLSNLLLLFVCIAPFFIANDAVALERFKGEWNYRIVSGPAFSTEAEAITEFHRTNRPGGANACGLPTFGDIPQNDWEPNSAAQYIDGILFQTNKTYLATNVGCQNPMLYAIYFTVTKWRLVCGIAQRYDARDGKCWNGVDEIQPDGAGSNSGACPNCVGQPINPTTGNMWHVIEDYAAATPLNPLSIRRTYNSSWLFWDPTAIRSFGVRWTQEYDIKLMQESGTLPAYKKACWRRSDGLLICDGYTPASLAIPAAVAIIRANGKRFLFVRSGNNFISDANVNDRITPVLDAGNTAVVEWSYYDSTTENTERFNADGLLLSISNRNNVSQHLTYSNGTTNDTSAGRIPDAGPICPTVHAGAILPAGRLLCVTDQAGRTIQFKYDVKGRVVEAIDPAAQSYFYEYDGPSGGCVAGNETSYACKANNLTKVIYPDGKSHTYVYNEASRINFGNSCGTQAMYVPIGNGFGPYPNHLTGLVDENGTRYISWSYNCSQRATFSELAGGVEKVGLTYSTVTNGTVTTRTSTVTHTVGTTETPQTTVRAFTSGFILGVGKNTAIDQPCVECGSIKARTYDANGNLASTTDFNNSITKYFFDLSRNLETSRVEAFGTAIARTKTTVWHAAMRLPIQVAEPLRMTNFEYDSVGNLLVKTVQATTDTNGSSGVSAVRIGPVRTWRYTYNAFGQVLTATGPRNGMLDVTTYTYDAQGNISSVTNAAGHQTGLSNYDVNGRVGRIVDPNGLVTTLAYSPRGWLQSRTVGNETTTYTYDGVGQLIKVTQPDGSAVNYTYSDAHRLTGISDDAGNSIAYTLDLLGNRIGEQVLDANGVLSRKVTRIYDTLGRLKTITGAQQ
jgi:YD repeat-containing protein